MVRITEYTRVWTIIVLRVKYMLDLFMLESKNKVGLVPDVRSINRFTSENRLFSTIIEAQNLLFSALVSGHQCLLVPNEKGSLFVR